MTGSRGCINECQKIQTKELILWYYRCFQHLHKTLLTFLIPCLLLKFIPFPTSSFLNLETGQVPVYNLIWIEWVSWKPWSNPFSISQLSTLSLLTLPGFSISLKFASSSSLLLISFRLTQLAKQECLAPLHSFWITAHWDFCKTCCHMSNVPQETPWINILEVEGVLKYVPPCSYFIVQDTDSQMGHLC